MVARDIALSRATGGRVHFLHLSTAGSIDLVRRARAEGVPVTAEVAPHHFTLTDGCTAGYDPVFKVNPPLRPQADVDAVKAALADGTADAIATDHAPHAPELKDLPFDQAPPGMLGLQTALALAVTELDLPIERIVALLSWQPAGHRRARPGPRRHPGRPGRAGGCGQPVRHRPVGHLDGRPDGTRLAQPQHPLRRPQPDRPGAPHRAGRRAGRDRRGGPAMSPRNGSIRRRAGPPGAGRRRSVRRRGLRRRARRRDLDRRGRVQHRALGLPGGHHRSVVRRTGDRLHLPPHRQLRGEPDRRRGRPARTAAAWWCATWPTSPSNWRSTGTLEDFLEPPPGGRDHRGRHPAADPPPARPRVGAVRLRHRRRVRPGGRGPRRRRPPTGATWCRR